MLTALKQLRLDHYVSERATCNPVRDSNLITLLLQFNLEYNEYCTALLSSHNEVTRYISQFMEMADSWFKCKESVRVGDWAVLESESIHSWLPVWAFTRKPQYLMETMRRIETIYNLQADQACGSSSQGQTDNQLFSLLFM